MKYAGIPWRAVATIVDILVLGILIAVAMILILDLATSSSPLSDAEFLRLTIFWIVVIPCVWAYYIIMEARFGATVGKLLCRLKVVQLNGHVIGWREAVIRTIVRLVDSLGVYLVAAICVWVSNKKQRLGDRISGTTVVHISK